MQVCSIGGRWVLALNLCSLPASPIAGRPLPMDAVLGAYDTKRIRLMSPFPPPH
jgi:hypothetical protein